MTQGLKISLKKLDGPLGGLEIPILNRFLKQITPKNCLKFMFTPSLPNHGGCHLSRNNVICQKWKFVLFAYYLRTIFFLVHLEDLCRNTIQQYNYHYSSIKHSNWYHIEIIQKRLKILNYLLDTETWSLLSLLVFSWLLVSSINRKEKRNIPLSNHKVWWWYFCWINQLVRNFKLII